MRNVRNHWALLILILISNSMLFSPLEAMTDSDAELDSQPGSEEESSDATGDALLSTKAGDLILARRSNLYIPKSSDPALWASNLKNLLNLNANEEDRKEIIATINKAELFWLSLDFYLTDGHSHYKKLVEIWEDEPRRFNYKKIPAMIVFALFYDPYFNKTLKVFAIGGIGIAGLAAIQRSYIDHGYFNDPNIVNAFCQICAETWQPIFNYSSKDLPIKLSNSTLYPTAFYDQPSCPDARENAQEALSLLWNHSYVSTQGKWHELATYKSDDKNGFLVYILQTLYGEPYFIESYRCSNSMTVNVGIFVVEHFIPIAATAASGITAMVGSFFGKKYLELPLNNQPVPR